MLRLKKSNINLLYEKLSSTCSLYLPVEKDGKTDFRKYDAQANVAVETLNTDRSAKDLFFPQSENMVAFKMEGKNIEIIEQERSKEQFVLFGVRPCDVRSFDVLDRVFLANPVDSYYAARRENGTIVSLACNNPDKTCFCKVFGIDAADPKGDVACWFAGEYLYWQSNTDKGAALTEKVKDLFEECGDEEVKAEQTAIREKVDAQPFADLSLEGFTGDRMNEIFASPKWAKLSQACLGCGTCTFTCPTCQCYDIRDYDTGHGVQRYRCWDSCMYSDFTMMAAATNRPTQLERFRQRFMHKLVYYPMNNDGMFSCVGCGRCLRKCPIHMNIVKVIKELGVKKDD